MPPDRLHRDYEVLSRHADANGRIAVRALVSMLLDAADVHAAQWRVSLGQLSTGSHTWVLSRLHLRLDRQPAWDERISVETWPTGALRVLAGRDFRIDTDQGPIGSATTLWLMIDRNTRKPVSLPDFIKAFEPPEGSPAVRARGNWPAPSNGRLVAQVDRSVRWADLDLNQHATAPAYMEWLLGPLPADIPQTGWLSELDILFKEETFLDEAIEVEIGELECPAAGAREFSHAVRRAHDDALLASARTRWVNA